MMTRLAVSRRFYLLLLLALLLLAGTFGVSINAGAGQESGEPFLENPAENQTLRLAGPIVLDSLDPAFAKDLPTMFLIRQIYSGLMRFDENLEPTPAIAESAPQ